jgi:ubiquitin-activating enzyme E1
LDYIIAAANLHAFNYGLHGTNDPQVYIKVATAAQIPEWKPNTKLKVQINDNDPPPEQPKGNIHLIHMVIIKLTSYSQTKTTSES